MREEPTKKFVSVSYEETFSISERISKGNIISLFPLFPRVEIYPSPLSLYSIGVSYGPVFQPKQTVSSISLHGHIVPHRLDASFIDAAYSVGVSHEVVPTIQRWQWGVERWELLTFPPDYDPWWLRGFFLRYFWVHNEKIYLLLLPREHNPTFLCRLVILGVDNNNKMVYEQQVRDIMLAFDVVPNADKWGHIEVGHYFVVFSRLFDFMLLSDDISLSERFRVIYMSPQYRALVRNASQLFTPFSFAVPEGILLLPMGIYFDLETYSYLPQVNLSMNNTYKPLRLGYPVLVSVPSDFYEEESLIERAYIWSGLSRGFRSVEVSDEFPPYAPFGEGAFFENVYISYGANSPVLDERLIYMYKLTEDGIVVEPLPLFNNSVLPLSSAALLLQYMPTGATTKWLEQYFQIVSNGVWLYTVRLWNRIYRFNLEGGLELAAVVPVWTGFYYDYLTPEMPCQTLLSYDRVYGQLYAVLRYGDQNYLTVVRQEGVVSVPPTPTIDSVNWSTGYVVFTPGVYQSSQEFIVNVIHQSSGVVYAFSSWDDRRLWEYSTNGGLSWQPMVSAVKRLSESDNVKVRIKISFQPLRSSDYDIKVVAYAVNG